MKTAIRMMCVAAIVAALGSAAVADVNIETVPVGNAGNANDTHGAGYGGVAYAYNIGKYEVTAGQYAEFLNAVAATATYSLYDPRMWSHNYGCKIQQTGSPGSYSYSVASDYANRPVNYVTWGDSARFANWLTNGQPTGTLTGTPELDAWLTEDGSYDLNGAMNNAALLAVSRESDWKWAVPTEDEWYKAAYHKNDGATGNYFDYPTSSDSAPGYINNSGNFSGTGGSFIEGGTDPGDYATYNGDGGTYGIGSPYYRTEVGEHENSASPYDTFDQGGNVWEWNEAILPGSFRCLRGGTLYSPDGHLHASLRTISHPADGSYALGFRVSQTPVPGAALLGMIGLGMVGAYTRKRRLAHVTEQ